MSLVTNQVREGKSLEYKQELPGNSDSDKKEFLADVSSFANAGGGHLIYGCKEKREDGQPSGLPEELIGLPDINADFEINRLSQIVLFGIEPRIQGFEIGVVTNSQQAPLVVVSIPKSLDSPHMVKFQNHSRFFSRTDGGKFQLDVNDIRSSILKGRDLRENISSFCLQRISKIRAGETPIPVSDGIQVVLHIVPIDSFASDRTPDLSALSTGQNLCPLNSNGWGHRYNFDGLLVNSTYSEATPALSYVQVFRSGALEAFMSYGDDDRRLIPSLSLEKTIIDGIGRYSKSLEELDRRAPMIVRLSLLNTQGALLAIKSSGFWPDQEFRLKENDLLLPEVYLEEVGEAIAPQMRSAFDVLWQAAGHRRSINFDINGKWSPKA